MDVWPKGVQGSKMTPDQKQFLSSDAGITQKKFLEELAYCLASMHRWFHEIPNLSVEVRKEQYQNFQSEACVLVRLAAGTQEYPLGAERKDYQGVYMPENMIEALKTLDVWPLWYKGPK